MLRFLFLALVVAGGAALPGLVEPAKPHRNDMNHSTVGFSVPILGGISQVTGKFSRFELQLDYDAEEPQKSRVLAKIDASSVDTGIDERDAHLREEDFFAVEKHPQILFEGFEVTQVTDDELTVLGVLTLREVSEEVTLKVRILREEGGQALGFHATTSFDRQKFGVRYKHRDIPNFIGDEVTVELHILTHPVR